MSAYDGMVLIASIILFVPILLISFIVFLILRKLRFVPRSLSAFALIALGGYSMLLLYEAAQMFVLRPARLQAEYLGRVYGGPLELREYAHAGFADTMDGWRYALNDNAVADLKRRCLPPLPPPFKSSDCRLYEGHDQRFISVGWLEGDTLHILDGQ